MQSIQSREIKYHYNKEYSLQNIQNKKLHAKPNINIKQNDKMGQVLALSEGEILIEYYVIIN